MPRGNDSSVCGDNEHVDLGGCFKFGQPCCVCNEGYVGTADSGCLDATAAGAAAAAVAASGCRMAGGTATADGDCVMPGEAPPRPEGCPACPACAKPAMTLPAVGTWSWPQFIVGAVAGVAGGMLLAEYLKRNAR